MLTSKLYLADTTRFPAFIHFAFRPPDNAGRLLLALLDQGIGRDGVNRR